MPNTSPPTWNDVKRLFQGVDIAYMKMLQYPLDDYLFVAQNARTLLSRLRDGSMPPRPFNAWTPEMLQQFEAWIEGGLQRSDAAVAERYAGFIRLSEFLTGFDDLHENPELAEEYYERLATWPSSDAPAVDPKILERLIRSYEADPNSFEQDVLPIEANASVAKTVILLWYTGAFIDLSSGFPVSPPTGAEPATGGQQYPKGLVWRAVLAHPMAYSAEGYRGEDGKYHLSGRPYWAAEPKADGTDTGLGPESYKP